MKKFLLSLAMVSIVAAIHAPLIVRSAQGDVTGAGRRFVELLAKENFSGAVAQFDDTMKTVSPEPKLRETWQNIQVLNGPFQKQLGVRATKLAGYDVVLVTCQFKQMALDAKVVFDAKGQVTGFFFVTTHPAANPGEPPPYARTHAFREKEFTVGRGEWQLPGTLTLLTAGGGPWLAVVLVHRVVRGHDGEPERRVRLDPRPLGHAELGVNAALLFMNRPCETAPFRPPRLHSPPLRALFGV